MTEGEFMVSLAQYLPYSFANGPGKRCVLWFQGCDKRCLNCCNPSFQEIKQPNIDLQTIQNQIIKDFNDSHLRGITFSGGEPLLNTNKESIQRLSEHIKKYTDMDIMVFTGYESIPQWANDYIDLAIAGPYIDDLKHTKGLIASTNQKIVRFNHKFNDITDDDIINGERIVEAYYKDGWFIISGLIDSKERVFDEQRDANKK